MLYEFGELPELEDEEGDQHHAHQGQRVNPKNEIKIDAVEWWSFENTENNWSGKVMSGFEIKIKQKKNQSKTHTHKSGNINKQKYIHTYKYEGILYRKIYLWL